MLAHPSGSASPNLPSASLRRISRHFPQIRKHSKRRTTRQHVTSKTQHIDFANKLLHNVHKYKSEKDWSHLLIPKKYNVSGHSAVFQKSMVDQNETLLQKPFPLFSEEVNAHLEQLNETVYYNDPVLVAFTLTTDQLPRGSCTIK